MPTCSCNIRQKSKYGDRLSTYQCLTGSCPLYQCTPQSVIYARAYRNLLVYNMR